jgi:hypothetical protein
MSLIDTRVQRSAQRMRVANTSFMGADACVTAVCLTGGDFPLETCGEELLVGPGLVAGTLGEPVDGGGHRGGFQRTAEVGEIRAGHHATPSTRS